MGNQDINRELNQVKASPNQSAERGPATESGPSQASQVTATSQAEEQARQAQDEKPSRLEEAWAEERRRRTPPRAFMLAQVLANVAGGPTWVALDADTEQGRALLITRDIVTRQVYHSPGGAITWEDCSLRKWLNTEFFDSLPGQLKARVHETIIDNPNNIDYGTQGGQPTKDRVFLLSLDEAGRFLTDDAKRTARYLGLRDWWWLRSPGLAQSGAASVHSDGRVLDDGSDVSLVGGVRPALFLNLET